MYQILAKSGSAFPWHPPIKVRLPPPELPNEPFCSLLTTIDQHKIIFHIRGSVVWSPLVWEILVIYDRAQITLSRYLVDIPMDFPRLTFSMSFKRSRLIESSKW
jgi:hypothetical protein